MRTLVAYTSQTGFTKRYAEWVAEAQGCEAVSIDEENVDAGPYDAVVFGGWFHAASFVGSKWLRRQRAEHPDVRFVAFAVGATPSEWTDMVDEGMQRAFPSPEFDGMPRFYLRGGFAYDRLSAPNKLMMKLFFKMQEKQAADDERASEMLVGMREGFDACDRAAIEPLLACVRADEAGRAGGVVDGNGAA